MATKPFNPNPETTKVPSPPQRREHANVNPPPAYQKPAAPPSPPKK